MATIPKLARTNYLSRWVPIAYAHATLVQNALRALRMDSWGVGTGDVERAVRRAALLGQTGLHTLPVVAGERITDEAAELARAMRVWQVLDGRVTGSQWSRTAT
jgi:hypothetical protein